MGRPSRRPWARIEALLARTPLSAWLPDRVDTHPSDQLSALLDDELSDEEALRVTRHVVDCASCAEELEEVRRCREVLRALPRLDPPRELYAMAPGSVASGRPGRRLRRVAAAIGLSGAIIGGAAFAAGGDDASTVAPSVERYVHDHVARTDGGPVLSPVDLGR